MVHAVVSLLLVIFSVCQASDTVETVVVNVTGDPLSEPYSCPGSTAMFSGTTVLYLTTSWPAAALGDGTARSDGCQRADRRVRVEVTYQPVGAAIVWFIDSVSTSHLKQDWWVCTEVLVVVGFDA